MNHLNCSLATLLLSVCCILTYTPYITTAMYAYQSRYQPKSRSLFSIQITFIAFLYACIIQKAIQLKKKPKKRTSQLYLNFKSKSTEHG